MSLTVNLWSRKTGELKQFLDSYYDRDAGVNENQGEWACVYTKPLEAVDIISAVMDNCDRFQINILIQVDDGQFHHVTLANHNEIIKDIFNLFYKEESVTSFN